MFFVIENFLIPKDFLLQAMQMITKLNKMVEAGMAEKVIGTE